MIRLPADTLRGPKFEIKGADQAQLRYAYARCALRRDLWDGVCVELEEALEELSQELDQDEGADRNESVGIDRVDVERMR